MKLKFFVKKIANAFIRRTFWFNEEIFPDCKKLWSYNTFNTQVVNLGSTSAVYAFNYDNLPIKAANWALRQNPLSGDQAILNNYCSYLRPQGSTVIFSLCVFSGLSGSYNLIDDKYYSFLSPSSMPNFSLRRQQVVRELMNNPYKYFPLYAFWGELKNFFKNKYNRVMTEREMKIDSDNWMNGWLKEFSIKDFSLPLSLLNKDGISDTVSLLNSMFYFCKVRNISPVIVIPPIYHTLSEKFSREAIDVLLTNVFKEIEDKSIRVFNCMDDPLFSHDPSLFRNSFLLNEKGSKLFTEKILKELSLI